ncbi:nicotinamide riboside transporter PnuC [Glycomyces niveus]|uniref:Nicotinamide mononucleotide transporter n=1 Tax=Glycomyces niveus TaxID=2820287 RepID=A0ABS3TZS5_9ACTN|nr:nicotinamide riboside transporter PnuC [Glycomyces sp. NEAU-S30]MBO3732009.1 nicotinamide mononucleotide transporter [Glycomyces sp. NEAU-S30]
MNALMEILYFPLFTIADVPTTLAEGLAFVTGALCVWLVARQHIANWGIGIANCLLFILIFTDSGLYADAALQIVFIALGVYGWWNWVKGGGPAADTLPVSRTGRLEWFALTGAGLIGLAGIAVLLTTATDSTVPSWDALTTVLSLMATYGQCRKRVESWYLWIAADIVYVPLYAYKGLYLTSILYIGFMALCVMGLLNWRKDLAAQAQPAEAAA